MTDVPSVAYVIAVLNDAARLPTAVHSALGQEYAGSQQVVIAVAPSSDGTRAVADALSALDPRVRVIDNPRTDIPAGLNAAIAAAQSDIIVRVDSHTELPPGYTRRMVAELAHTGAANVGGVMFAQGSGRVQESVARAYNSPAGLGGGVYHGGDEAGPADSAYLGVFRREVLLQVGGYDESLRRGEDYDLNQRIIAAGHLVWFVPDVEVRYSPRSSRSALAQQMFATGAWRGEMVRRSPRGTATRYLAPPALVLGLVASSVAGVLSLTGRPVGVLALAHIAPVAYVGMLGYAATSLTGAQTTAQRLDDVVTLAAMHLSWGAGFLKGLVVGAGGTVDTSRVR